MIKEIYFHRLEPNKIYYIKKINNNFEAYTKCIGTFIKYYEVPGSLGYKVACFINVSEFNTTVDPWRACPESGDTGVWSLRKTPSKNTYNYNFNADTQFYEVKKYQIQQAMEDRALNLILKNITGDEYFE
jgi:hypothetical protein